MEEEGCDLCGKTWCMCGRIHEKNACVTENFEAE